MRSQLAIGFLMFTALNAGCERESRVALPEAPGTGGTQPVAAPTGTDVGKQPTETSPDAGTPPTNGKPPAPPLAPFEPPAFEPPSQRSAQQGDGEWTPWGGQTEAGGPLLYRSSVHPHAVSRFVRMDVVAIDLRRVSVDWMIGSKDEHADELASLVTPGLIPKSSQERTIAIFNGGFLARHGRWGIASRGVVLQPPKPGGCVVALREDGPDAPVVLGTWSKLGLTEADLRALRQTPPCLVEDGKLNPRLERGQDRPWAGNNPNRKTRRRSALGLDAKGEILFYAIGIETEPLHLARGMQAVGARTALQLDINWSWTRFLLPSRGENGLLRATQALVEDTVHAKNEYFSRPSERDFFYVVLRPD